MDGVFSFAFAVMWITFSDKNQNFEIFCQKTRFKQNWKISGIPVVVIIIDKESIFLEMIHKK